MQENNKVVKDLSMVGWLLLIEEGIDIRDEMPVENLLLKLFPDEVLGSLDSLESCESRSLAFIGFLLQEESSF